MGEEEEEEEHFYFFKTEETHTQMLSEYVDK